MSVKKDEDLRIACWPAVMRKRSEVTPGSTLHMCAGCLSGIWAAPSTLAIAREHGATLWCIPCIAKTAPESEVVTSPIQDSEIRAFSGMSASDAMRLILGKRPREVK